MSDPVQRITLEMSLLDAVTLRRSAETVFRSYDGAAGVCLLCTHLFDSVGHVARVYGLEPEELLRRLNEEQ
jgi:hypothetical protein